MVIRVISVCFVVIPGGVLNLALIGKIFVKHIGLFLKISNVDLITISHGMFVCFLFIYCSQVNTTNFNPVML